uniref:Uncharacterized protein n=1 Tax=Rhizophora mucronata TaxID=61149 RepID=A0A2P2PE32_RHIMU
MRCLMTIIPSILKFLILLSKCHNQICIMPTIHT